MLKKLKDWLIWFFTDDSIKDTVKKQPASKKVSSSNIFKSLYDSKILPTENLESNFIYRYKSDSLYGKNKLYSFEIEKSWIRSGGNYLDFDTSFYSHIRSKTFTMDFPEYVQELIDIYNIKIGSVFSLKSEPNKAWRIADIKPMIVSGSHPSIRDGKFYKSYSYQSDYSYTAVFEMSNLENNRDTKFVLFTDLILINIDQEKLKFREEVKEHIEDYFLEFIDSGAISYNFNLISGDYVAEVSISFLKKDQDSILDFMSGLMAVKKRIEQINKISFHLSNISMDSFKIRLSKMNELS